MFALIITFLLTVFAAYASEMPAQTQKVNQAVWTTDQSKCSGTNCRGVMNISYSECVGFGFMGAANLDNEEGVLAIENGSGVGIIAYVADGPDANLLLDQAPCVPPRVTVYGDMTGLGAIVTNPQNGVVKWLVVMTTTKYLTGSHCEDSYYLGRKRKACGSFYGQGFARQPIQTESFPGKTETYNLLLEKELLIIGG
jgi:hypothetical protein